MNGHLHRAFAHAEVGGNFGWRKRWRFAGTPRLELFEIIPARLVKLVEQYGKHAAAKKTGFQKDDIMLRLGEVGLRLTEGELIGALLQRHHVGEELPATVLRGHQRVELKLPMQ